MWSLLLQLSFGCCWVVFWWILPSSWLTKSHTSHQQHLYAVVQVLPEKNIQETKPTATKIIPTYNHYQQQMNKY